MHFSLRQLILFAILFKLLLVLVFGVVFAIKPHYQGQLGNKPNSFLYAFYSQDGNNYQAICTDGYQKKYVPNEREAIMYMAFLPGLPIVLCAFQWFPGSVDMVWYGGVVANLLLWILFVVALKYLLDGYYNNEKKKYYILLFFSIFPTSFFLQLNYTETLFLPLSFFIWRLIDENKIRAASLLGFLLSFVRITAIPFGFVMWLKYTYNTFRTNRSLPLRAIFLTKKYILDSLSFATYGFGALLTFAYFKLEYNNFGLFFKSQKDYYARDTGFDSAAKTFFDVLGLSEYHWVESYRMYYWDNFDFTQQISNTGFYFYDKVFRQLNLYTLPFLFAILASLLLIKKKRYFELFYSWVLWLVPMVSDSNSINRYLLQSFPFLIVVAEASFDNKKMRIPVLVVCFLLYMLYFLLHAYGFWIA
jgi:hypothetical protein